MIPLSFAQRRYWFLHQLERDETWNMSAAFRLTGSLDKGALVAAICDVVERHEILRTTYVTNDDGEPYQHILPVSEAFAQMRMPVVEVAPEDVPDAVAEAVAHGFDLATEIPFRASLFCCSAEEHVLVLVIHHIATDGSSGAPLARDLATAYTARREGRVPEWEPLPVQYKDYTLWQREVLGDVADPESLAAAQVEYWRKELAGIPQPLSLPLDRPRSTEVITDGDAVGFVVKPEVAAGLEKLAADRGTTMSMVMQAALAVLLCRLGSGEDVPIATPIAGRTDEALADLIGCFVNNLVLRVDLSGNPSFGDLLTRVRDKALAAYEHQDLPFDVLVESINPDRSAAYQPLFQVMSGWQNYERPALDLTGLNVEFQQALTSKTVVDLYFSMTKEPSGTLLGDIQYGTQLFDRDTVDAMAARFARVLEQLVADPGVSVGNVDVLSAEERQRLLVDVNDTAEPIPDLVEAIRRQVQATPEALAIISEEESLTYQELDVRSNRLAHWLVDRGVRAESLVAVCLPRTADLMVALLAVLKAGGAYVPIDPDHPRSRIDFVLRHADPVLVLDVGALAGANLSRYPDSAPAAVVRPDDAQYVIYTSGSTGTPKGVTVPRGAVANFVATTQRRFPLSPADRMLFSTTVSFDMANTELYLPFVSGATMVMAKKDTVTDPSAVMALLRRHGVTVVQATPAFWQMLLMHEPNAANGLRIIIGAEAVPARLAQTLAEQAAEVGNWYGPTETTTWSTMAPVTAGAGVAIGSPVGNTQVYVLDSRLRPVPRGVQGELYIAGVGMARGYQNRPDMTAERFVACPFSPAGARMYRTGDLVRWNKNDQLEYIARTDLQVKVRGFRIELGEIEHVLTGHPGVAQAAVAVRENQEGDKLIVAYVVPASDAVVPDAGVRVDGELLVELSEYLRGSLPEYMVPSAVIPLPVIPLTPNGKLDRQALPSEQTETVVTQEPRDAHEEKLCAHFSELLGREKIGIHDDFFALGGHSLLATRLSVRIRKEFGVDMPLRTIIKYPTVAELASLVLIGGIPVERADPFAVVLPLNNDPGTGKEPLWFFHGGGGLGWAYFSFVTHVRDRSAYALQSRGSNGVDALVGSVEEMVDDYINEMRKIQPEGPYYLIGWSYGGTLVQAVAVELDRRGHQVALAAILDSHPGGQGFTEVHAGKTLSDYRAELEEFFGQYIGTDNQQHFLDTMSKVLANNTNRLMEFESPVYRGDVLFFNATLKDELYSDLWRPYVLGSIETHDVRATHHEMNMPASVAEVFKVINQKLDS